MEDARQVCLFFCTNSMAGPTGILLILAELLLSFSAMTE